MDDPAAYPALGPQDYGMTTALPGRDCLGIFLRQVPVVAANHCPCLFGFNLSASVRKSLVERDRVGEVKDPAHGRLLFSPEYRPLPTKNPHIYLNGGWHSLVGPIVLKTLHQAGDTLLLGRRVIEWAHSLQGIDPRLIPLHWSPEQGDSGSGMLIRRDPYGVEEWVFLMAYDGLSPVPLVQNLIADITPLLEARARRLGSAPRIRLMLAFAGDRNTPGRSAFKSQVHRYRKACDQEFLFGGSSSEPFIPLTAVRFAFGLVVGVKNRNPLHWRIWMDEHSSGAPISPSRPPGALTGASRHTRKYDGPLEKGQKLFEWLTSRQKAKSAVHDGGSDDDPRQDQS